MTLTEHAIEARKNAYAPYSKFLVGCALECDDGTIIHGCNVESASYGLTICAERTALVKAISDGKRIFKAIAIAADTDQLTPPCGACRQLIWELCGDIPVLLTNLRGKGEQFHMLELLPSPFGRELLEDSLG
jgi:cytidine deaminase